MTESLFATPEFRDLLTGYSFGLVLTAVSLPLFLALLPVLVLAVLCSAYFVTLCLLAVALIATVAPLLWTAVAYLRARGEGRALEVRSS